MDRRTALWLWFTALMYANAQDGGVCRFDEYYVDDTGECVRECPCGTYANSNRHCSEGSGLFFNQTQFNFKLVAADISDTPLVSTVLYIDQTLLDDGPTFEIVLHGPQLRIAFFFFQAATSRTLRLVVNNSSSTGNSFQNQQFNVTDDFLQCTYNETKTFVIVPVQVYAVSFTGEFSYYLQSRQSNKFQFADLNGRGQIDSGCSGDLKYLFSTGQCVESCPCGMYNSYGSCLLNPAIVFESEEQTIRVIPSTMAGSTLTTVTLLIDTAFLTDKKITQTSDLTIVAYSGVVQHNNSGDVIPHFRSNVRPLFKMVSKANASDSSDFSLRFNLRQLRDSSLMRCAGNNTSYLVVPLDLTLRSDSLFHLGDHSTYIYAALQVNGSFNLFILTLQLKVEAECPGSLNLYDFTIHQCVSQCTCGYSPFHSHTTAYCEAVEYGPSEFINDRASSYVTSLPTTASINLYVNLDNFYFFAFGIRDTIIARLEINSSFSRPNPPQVSFVQPNGNLNSSVEIVLNSSIDFRYCYDRLRNKSHSLYQVPIIIAMSSNDESILAANQFRIQLSHYSPNNPILTQGLQLFRNDSLDLFVNYTFVDTGSISAVAVGVPVGIVGGVAIIAAMGAVIAAIVCILVRRRRQKVGNFAQFTNDDKENVYFTESESHIYETVSPEEVDSIAQASEENGEHNGLEKDVQTDN